MYGTGWKWQKRFVLFWVAPLAALALALQLAISLRRPPFDQIVLSYGGKPRGDVPAAQSCTGI